MMKLNKALKERIDRYFNEISANELYSILTEKYNFVNNDNDTVIVDNGKYVCKTDIISEFVDDVISYANLDVKQEFEVVEIKFLEDTSNIQNEEIVCDKSCSIPLAA